MKWYTNSPSLHPQWTRGTYSLPLLLHQDRHLDDRWWAGSQSQACRKASTFCLDGLFGYSSWGQRGTNGSWREVERLPFSSVATIFSIFKTIRYQKKKKYILSAKNAITDRNYLYITLCGRRVRKILTLLTLPRRLNSILQVPLNESRKQEA